MLSDVFWIWESICPRIDQCHAKKKHLVWENIQKSAKPFCLRLNFGQDFEYAQAFCQWTNTNPAIKYRGRFVRTFGLGPYTSVPVVLLERSLRKRHIEVYSEFSAFLCCMEGLCRPYPAPEANIQESESNLALVVKRHWKFWRISFSRLNAMQCMDKWKRAGWKWRNSEWYEQARS